MSAFTNFVRVNYGSGSVLLWRRYDMLSTSSFIAHSGPYEGIKNISGGARVFAARGKRLCCRPRRSDRQSIFLWLQRLRWCGVSRTLR